MKHLDFRNHSKWGVRLSREQTCGLLIKAHDLPNTTSNPQLEMASRQPLQTLTEN